MDRPSPLSKTAPLLYKPLRQPGVMEPRMSFRLFVAPLAAAIIFVAWAPLAQSTQKQDSRLEAEFAPLIPRLIAAGLSQHEVKAALAAPGVRFDPGPMRSKLRGLYTAMFNPERLENIVWGLSLLGLHQGPAVYDEALAHALQRFQTKRGLFADGLPTLAAWRAINQALPPAQRKPDPPARPTGTYKGALGADGITKAKAFIADHKSHFDAAARKTSVPPEYIAAILLTETRFGANVGQFNAVTILASMAASGDPQTARALLVDKNPTPLALRWAEAKAKEKADWAFTELAALLKWAKSAGKNPAALPASPYGALGLCQFMPSNLLLHGVDADGDGKVDPFAPADAVASIGAYFKAYGWKPAMTEEDKRSVVYGYNHSEVYVNTILAQARLIAQAEHPAAKPASPPKKSGAKPRPKTR